MLKQWPIWYCQVQQKGCEKISNLIEMEKADSRRDSRIPWGRSHVKKFYKITYYNRQEEYETKHQFFFCMFWKILNCIWSTISGNVTYLFSFKIRIMHTTYYMHFKTLKLKLPSICSNKITIFSTCWIFAKSDPQSYEIKSICMVVRNCTIWHVANGKRICSCYSHLSKNQNQSFIIT